MSHLQALLQDGLLGTRNVENAALISLKDKSCKAASKNFVLSKEQCVSCVVAFENPPQVREDGFDLSGTVFNVVRADRNSIYCKAGSRVGCGGIILVQTEEYVIVAEYAEGMYASVCVESVEKLADYFRAKGH